MPIRCADGHIPDPTELQIGWNDSVLAANILQTQGWLPQDTEIANSVGTVLTGNIGILSTSSDGQDNALLLVDPTLAACMGPEPMQAALAHESGHVTLGHTASSPRTDMMNDMLFGSALALGATVLVLGRRGAQRWARWLDNMRYREYAPQLPPRRSRLLLCILFAWNANAFMIGRNTENELMSNELEADRFAADVMGTTKPMTDALIEIDGMTVANGFKEGTCKPVFPVADPLQDTQLFTFQTLIASPVGLFAQCIRDHPDTDKRIAMLQSYTPAPVAPRFTSVQSGNLPNDPD